MSRMYLMKSDSPVLSFLTSSMQIIRGHQCLDCRIQGTLATLGDLVQKYYFAHNNLSERCHAPGYRFYTGSASSIHNKHCCSSSSSGPYWLLMTKSVHHGTLGQSWQEQYDYLLHTQTRYSSTTPLRLPYALEAATCILAHYAVNAKQEISDDDSSQPFLFPTTYTRCLDTTWEGNLIIVGGFNSMGLMIGCCGQETINYDEGIATCFAFLTEKDHSSTASSSSASTMVS